MRRRAISMCCGVLVLAGCGSGGSGQSVVLDSGQAAVSAQFRVAQQEVADSVGLVLAGLGEAPGDPPPGLATATTQRIVLNRLIASYSEANGITLTQTQVEDGLSTLAAENGGADALRALALQAGIPAEELEDTIATNLLVTAIGKKLNAAGDTAAQSESARLALAQYSGQIDVEVAPRYGTWNDELLGIVPGSTLTQSAAQGQVTP